MTITQRMRVHPHLLLRACSALQIYLQSHHYFMAPFTRTGIEVKSKENKANEWLWSVPVDFSPYDRLDDLFAQIPTNMTDSFQFLVFERLSDEEESELYNDQNDGTEKSENKNWKVRNVVNTFVEETNSLFNNVDPIHCTFHFSPSPLHIFTRKM